jgi:hypothetical protein
VPTLVFNLLSAACSSALSQSLVDDLPSNDDGAAEPATAESGLDSTPTSHPSRRTRVRAVLPTADVVTELLQFLVLDSASGPLATSVNQAVLLVLRSQLDSEVFYCSSLRITFC